MKPHTRQSGIMILYTIPLRISRESKGAKAMQLKEANSRLKTAITAEQLRRLNPLHRLLDLDTDDFCKVVDAVGADKLTARAAWYERLDRAERELKARESNSDAALNTELDKIAGRMLTELGSGNTNRQEADNEHK
jgi:hypothetical protein